jgi:DNA-binding response OmpR family regulator
MPLKRFEPSVSCKSTNGIKRSILLCVEDDLTNGDLLKMRLRKKYDVLVARDDREACKLISEHSGEIEVFLMDIHMQNSELNGIQLVKLVQGKLNRDLVPDYASQVPLVDKPVIFITAFGNQYPEVKQIDALLVHKPVNFVELEMALAQVLLKKSGESKVEKA